MQKDKIVETHLYTCALISSTICKSILVNRFYVLVNIAIVINGLYQVVIGHNTTKSPHVFTIVHCDTLNTASIIVLLSIKMASYCTEKAHQCKYHFNCPSALWHRENIGGVTMN